MPAGFRKITAHGESFCKITARVGTWASIGVTGTIGLLGPSSFVPALPGGGPPFSLTAHPSPNLVLSLAVAALVLGTGGLAAGLCAVRQGWRPSHLHLGGALAAITLAFLPPSGSADHLNYAAYGRMVRTGHDPYAVTPDQIPSDPVIGAVEDWGNATSVYGPVATALQTFASWIGGDSLRLTVFVLALINAAAFIGTGLLLRRLAGNDPRAALLWTLNPLLLYHLVAGMHVDTVAIAFAVAALAAVARAPLAGLLFGLGIAVKLNVGLVALGPAWALRHQLRRLSVIAGVATVTLAGSYLIAGRHALDQVRWASRSVSRASPWHLISGRDPVLGFAIPREAVQVLSFLLLVALAWLLLRALPRPLVRHDRDEAAWVACAVAIAYLLSAAYVLPWYDGLAFALLALIPASAMDGFAVARLAVLSVGYLPARANMGPEWLFTVVRSQVVPVILTGLLAALVWWAVRRARQRSASLVRTPPAPTAPPR